ncbi:MAG: SCO family protein [Candidatus Poseidonia sp.]|nr:SCO family protein [Poseidonia sp.]
MRPAQKAWLALLLVSLLLAPASAYMGKQLARGPVDSFTLTAQNGENYTFGSDTQGVVIVSFIFTRCPDVCPVLTQSLTAVEAELTDAEREDVTFVSITVDPEYDTPEALTEYSERMGASWPHLTGTPEEMQAIWDTFGVVVQQNVIDMHVMDYEPGEASVTVVNTSNQSSHHMFAWSGWTLTQTMASSAGWSVNSSVSEYGRMLHGINGVDSPSDWSWWWELNLWNATNETWESSDVGMDGVDGMEHPHVAWMPSNGNRTLLPSPNETQATSISVQWPNGTHDQIGQEAFTAYHITQGALNGAGVNSTIEATSYGHYLSSLGDEDAPDDYAWWWNLYGWNETSELWESSNVGMDDYLEPLHLAWAPSYTNVSTIPAPVSDDVDETVCNGHGWEMGSGSSKHCMCDSGYTWAEGDQLSCVPETTEEYNVGHSTITYILNADLEPTVAWTGDSWLVEDFTADVRELLEKEQLGGYEADLIPSPSLLMTATALLAAFAFVGVRRTKQDNE